MNNKNKDSLLPRSLFNASTLKLDSVDRSTNARRKRTEESQSNNSSKKRKVTILDSDDDESDSDDSKKDYSKDALAHPPQPHPPRQQPIGRPRSRANSISSISSSSSNDSEDEGSDIGALLIKLERQQARQTRYLDKVKHLNRSIKQTTRLIGDQVLSNKKKPVLKDIPAPPQLAKRSSPLDLSKREQRSILIDDDHHEVVTKSRDPTEILIPPLHHSKPATATATVAKKAPAAKKAVFPSQKIRATRTQITELQFGSSDKMDIYTVKSRQQEIMSQKKPRSLLNNIASTGQLSNLMISTSLDGELQFWNTSERRKIKTIGQQHLYDSWIDDICWATPNTLAFCPPQKSTEHVKLVHIINVTKSNVEGRIQALVEAPHENGISVINSLDTGSYNRNSESCSFVTGGYDKNVFLWSLKRGSPDENFEQTGAHRLNIKHTSTVYSLCYDSYKNVLLTGGADERLNLYDVQSATTSREIRLAQKVSQIVQSKANPNLMLITQTNRTEQFCMYDQRIPGIEGIQMKFGQSEPETLSRFIKPDMHENGYMVCCGSQATAKLNFWDLRYLDSARSVSFSMDTQAKTKALRTMFLPHSETMVSISSSRYMTWIDYSVQRDSIVKSLL